MSKISLQDMASVLVERWHLGKKEASLFVNEMFFVIQKSLDEDKIVKVKGLGTFKIIDVDDRESVNVNTGDRVLIEGHGKITFTPDALMKELVNRPFSQFETVVLKDGVDFDETTSTDTAAEVIAEPIRELEIKKEQVDYSEEIEDSSSSVPLVEFVTDEPQSVVEDKQEDPLMSKPTVEPLKSVESDPSDEKSEESENSNYSESSQDFGDSEISEEYIDSEKPESSGFKSYYKWIGITLLMLVMGILIGYLIGNRSQNLSQTPQELSVENNEKEVMENLMQDSDSIQVKTLETVEIEKNVEVQDVTAEMKTSETEKALLDKYESMDGRIRTGAYRILGTDTVVKAKSGETLTRICRRTIGPGMECYLEVYNGLSSGVTLTAGQEIKIPKLELKKKKKK